MEFAALWRCPWCWSPAFTRSPRCRTCYRVYTLTQTALWECESLSSHVLWHESTILRWIFWANTEPFDPRISFSLPPLLSSPLVPLCALFFSKQCFHPQDLFKRFHFISEWKKWSHCIFLCLSVRNESDSNKMTAWPHLWSWYNDKGKERIILSRIYQRWTASSLPGKSRISSRCSVAVVAR